jgi:nicotinate (nicotinamide) nucleotide adenylyltransferase/ribosome silencing factor RsfS/YbeB/iojap
MPQFFPVFGDRRMRRVGLLGGSFNPAHDGHVHISSEAKKRLGLDEVWWLVSPQNPLKPRQGMAPLAQRLQIARVLAGAAKIRVTDLESRIGATRTAKVVTSLKQRYPLIDFVWLMGADNLEQFSRWWRWPAIFQSVRVAVLDRSPYAYRALAGAAAIRFRARRTRPTAALFASGVPRWTYLAIRRHGASSTAIRQAQPQTIRPHVQEPTITTADADLEKKVQVILTSLDDSKGSDIVQFDVTAKTAMADRIIVASGTSTRQVTSMAEHLVTKLKSLGMSARSEGKAQGDWVLVDAGDVVIHLFRPEVRAFYDLERIWAGPVPKPAPTKSATKVARPKRKTAGSAKPKAKKAPVRKRAKSKPKRK